MAETNDFTLKIITPDRVFYEKPVKMVEFNTVEGAVSYTHLTLPTIGG